MECLMRYIVTSEGKYSRAGADFLFFSSRRRHTRFDCDWSSDVCSSDLIGEVVLHHVVCGFGGILLAHPERPVLRRSLDFGIGKDEGAVRRLDAVGVVGMEIGRASCRERV